jgi:hypothetical protein
VPGLDKRSSGHRTLVVRKLGTQSRMRAKLHVQATEYKPRPKLCRLGWLRSSWMLLTPNSSCLPGTLSPAARGVD